MCLTIYSETKPKPKKATRDIVVHKMLNHLYINPDEYYSSPRGSRYIQGKTYKEKKFGITATVSGWFARKKIYSIRQGLHSYKYDKTSRNPNLHKMIIPKGTKYFIQNGHYVSLALHWPK